MIVPRQQKYERAYAYGAAEVSRAGSVFCFQSSVHRDAVEKVRAALPGWLKEFWRDGARARSLIVGSGCSLQ